MNGVNVEPLLHILKQPPSGQNAGHLILYWLSLGSADGGSRGGGGEVGGGGGLGLGSATELTYTGRRCFLSTTYCNQQWW